MFGAVAAAAVLLLGAALALGPLADARHAVVAVDGRTADRAELRARLALDAVLADARRRGLRSLLAAGRMAAAEYERLLRAVDDGAADPLRAAVDGLVADAVARREAAARGLSPAVDPETELATAAQADAVVRIRVVTLAPPAPGVPAAAGGWPAPAPEGAPAAGLRAASDAALARAREALEAGAAAEDVAASLAAAGWRAQARDEWIPAVGPVDGLPDGILAGLRDPAAAGAVQASPADPLTGAAAAGSAVDRQGAYPAAVDASGLDAGALRAWAEARADGRVLRAALLAEWAGAAQPLVRAAELVVGASGVPGVDGSYASFAHLVVGRLPAAERGPGTDREAAGRLEAALAGMAPADRAARFWALVVEANASDPPDPLRASGETGYFAREQLLPALAAAAFGPGARAGDVVGPVDTQAGPELFLLRATFEGALDERSGAALVQARSAGDLPGLARSVSPAGEWPRADGTLWRAEAELAGSPVALAAYRDTAIGTVSAPFVLDGELLVARPEERRTGPVPSDALARLAARGYEAWLAGRIAAAVVVRDPEPLPGIQVATPTPAASADPVVGPGAIRTPYRPPLPALP